MEPCTVGFGKVSFATSGFSLSAFAVTPPHVRMLLSKAHPVVAGTSTIVYPASPDGTKEGRMYSQQVDVPEGTIVQVQASRTYHGARAADAALFLRIRATAAKQILHAKLPSDPKSLLGNRFVAFLGHFDVLSTNAAAGSGIRPSKGFINGFLVPEEQEELFAITELVEAAMAPPSPVIVKDNEGNDRTLFVPPLPKRRIRLNR